MFRVQRPQMSWNISLRQHAGQSPIHELLGSLKIDRVVYIMYKYILTCKLLLDRASVCMRSECAFIIVDFASSFSLESSRIDWTCALCDGFLVRCGPLGRRLVRIASMECCPVRGSGSGPHSKRTIYRRATSARTVPYPTLLYPDLPCPAALLYLCVYVSLLCVSDLTYLSPFVSLSLCYCRGDGRPSILQPFGAIPRPVRSFCRRARTSPPGTM
jgi:hypothetical protein